MELNLRFLPPRRNAYCLLVALLLCRPGFARGGEYDWKAFVEYDHISYFSDRRLGKFDHRNQVTAEFESIWDVAKDTRFFSVVEVRQDPSDPSRDRWRIDEAYVDFFLNDLDIRVGQQVIVWGRADIINPTDSMARRDLSDLIDIEDERMGLLALRAKYYLGNWTLEGIIAPQFKASPLPSQTSRWFPDLPSSIDNPFAPGTDLALTYSFLPPAEPANTLDNTQFAGKASSSASGWDFSLSYFDGWNDLPGIRQLPELLAPAEVRVSIRSEVSRLRTLGADFSTTFGRIGLRGEVGYLRTKRPQGLNSFEDDRYVHAVAGLDWTRADIWYDHDLFVLVEWSQQFSSSGIEYAVTDLDHVFRKSLQLNVEYGISSFLQLALLGVWNQEDGDHYLQPRVSYQLRDGLTFDAAIDFLEGPADSFFGGFRDNRRIQLRAKYSFSRGGYR